MVRAREQLIEAALDLAWSHWTGLGVRGTAVPPDSAIDPEALIYLTASLAAYDPRLRDEAADWWTRFQRHVSLPRLSHLEKKLDPHVVTPPNDWIWGVLSEAGLSTFSHTIGMNRGERWQFATWELGAVRVYSAEYAPVLSQADVARSYGQDAAGQARRDRPAVQLKLTRRA